MEEKEKDEFSLDSILDGIDSELDSEDNTVSADSSAEKSNDATKEIDIEKIKAKRAAEISENMSNRNAAKKPNTNTKTSKGKKKKSNKGCLASSIWILIILVVSVGIAVAALTFISDYTGVGKEIIHGSETVQINVEEGTSVSEIVQVLKDNNIIISTKVFKLYLKVSHKGNDMSYGAHDIDRNMSYGAILEELAKPAKAEDVTVTIKSGQMIDEIAAALEEKSVCKADDFIKELTTGTFESKLLDSVPSDEKIHYKAEGYLFPDTYSFYPNDDPHRVIQKMLDNLQDKFTDQMLSDISDKGLTVHKVLTMASIVELEAGGYKNEMPKVAAVFYNRINNPEECGGYLQSDPTMEYPYGDGAFNTYQSIGLPPGPLCNVTEQSIKAAIYPDTTCKAFYFVTDKRHNFYYNNTNEEHLETIADLRSRGLWAAQ